MIDLLGMVVFGTIVGIGLLDGRRGLSVFALYHWDGVPAAKSGHRRRSAMAAGTSPSRRRPRGRPGPAPSPAPGGDREVSRSRDYG